MKELRSIDDVPDPNVRAILAQMDPRGNSATMSIEQKRGGQLAGLARAGELAQVDSITEEVFTGRGGHSIRVRLYQPAARQTDVPVIVYLHGGGFYAGTLDTHDPVCRALAAQTPAIVAAVDYRLAPEHLWPAALEDTLDGLEWVSKRFEPRRLILAGDSAGGNLAACAALQTKLALAGQVLIYPMLDAVMSLPSYVENAFVPPFTLVDCVYVWQLCLPRSADRLAPELSPLYASPEKLKNLPPALILTAEYDILRDEGAEYAKLLRAAGVRAEHERYATMTHGFLLWGRTVPAAHETLARVAAFLRSL